MLRHESALLGARITTGKGFSVFIYLRSLGVRVVLLFRQGQLLIIFTLKNERFSFKFILGHIILGNGPLLLIGE